MGPITAEFNIRCRAGTPSYDHLKGQPGFSSIVPRRALRVKPLRFVVARYEGRDPLEEHFAPALLTPRHLEGTHAVLLRNTLAGS